MADLSDFVLEKLSNKDISVSKDVFKEIMSIVNQVDLEDAEDVIVSLIDMLKKDHQSNQPITMEIYRKITQSFTQDTSILENDVNEIEIVAFNDFGRIKFTPAKSGSRVSDMGLEFACDTLANGNGLVPGLTHLGMVEDATKSFCVRYRAIFQNLLKYIRDSPYQTQGTKIQSNVQTTNQIKFDPNNGSSTLLLGMLVKSKKNNNIYVAEDIEGSIELDLSDCEIISEFIVVDTFVLLEGVYQNNQFKVFAIGNPPEHSFTVEDLSPTRTTMDTFDNDRDLFPVSLHNQREQVGLAVFSEVWLNSNEVMDNLKQDLLTMCVSNSQPPVDVIIICGCFTSPDCADKLVETSNGLKSLVKFVTETSSIKDKNIVIVPSFEDPGLYSIMPRPPLPKSLLQSHGELLPNNYGNVSFASNPCKIKVGKSLHNEKIGAIEIAVVRCEILEKVCCNTFHMPTESADIPLEFAKFFLSQSHLLPLPPNSIPTVWPYDSHLFLYPKPDVIICASNYPKFVVEPSPQTLFVNPGSYGASRNNYFYQTINAQK